LTKRPEKTEPAPQTATVPDPIDRFGYVEGGALRIVKRSDPPGALIDFSSVLNRKTPSENS